MYKVSSYDQPYPNEIGKAEIGFNMYVQCPQMISHVGMEQQRQRQSPKLWKSFHIDMADCSRRLHCSHHERL